jgi:Ca2+-transporting ATPase
MAEPRGDVMDHPPRPADLSLFDRAEAEDIGIDGLGISVAALAAHFLALSRQGAGPATRTATFMTLALSQILHAWTLRDRSSGSLEARHISERRLEAALASSAGLLALPLLLPPLRRLLGISAPGASAVATALVLSGASFGFSEGRRIISRVSRAGEPAPG